MIMTEYLQKHPSTVDKVLTEHNLREYEKRAPDKDLVDLRGLLEGKIHTFVPFNNGWIIWRPCIHRNENAMEIASLYIGDGSTVISQDFWDAIKEEANLNNCDHIVMETERDPEVWEESYGFKVQSYMMEYKL